MKKYLIIVGLLLVVFLTYQVGFKSNAKKDYYENVTLKTFYPKSNDQVE